MHIFNGISQYYKPIGPSEGKFCFPEKKKGKI